MKKYISVLLVFLCLASCEDFLEESPRSTIAVHQFFQSQEDAQSAVNALYRTGYLSQFTNASNLAKASVCMSGMWTDVVWGQARLGDYANDLSLNAERSSQVLYGSWQSIYQAISRANSVLKYVNADIEGLSEAKANMLLAKARFFRALNYFSLVKDYGAIPLLLEPVESLDDIFVPRTDIRAVYEQILLDLNWARDNGNLPVTPFALNGFRLTRGAVQTLLAEVHMQMAGYPLRDENNYALAAQAARSVIQSGVYELIGHGPTLEESAYNIIRTSDVEREYILTVEIDETIAPSGWPMMAFPPGIQYPGLAYPGNIGPGFHAERSFHNLYDPDHDLRVQNQQFWYSQIEVGGEVINIAEQVGPIIWYFFDKRASFVTARGGQDTKLYRYPVVLLIAAESIALTEGVTAEAIGYLADVRSRAYWQMDRTVIEEELNGLTTQEFVEEVWSEILRELSVDFKLWDHLRRTRKYPVTTEGNPGVVTYVDLVGTDNTRGVTFQEYHLLYPIASEEMQRNPQLTQNPGYN